jgi:hypothetical protein
MGCCNRYHPAKCLEETEPNLSTMKCHSNRKGTPQMYLQIETEGANPTIIPLPHGKAMSIHIVPETKPAATRNPEPTADELLERYFSMTDDQLRELHF